MVCRLAVQAPSPPEAPEYPRDDLNVRHTAPEAVALSGLSYGGPTDSTVAVLYRVLTESATPLSSGFRRQRQCGTVSPRSCGAQGTRRP